MNSDSSLSPSFNHFDKDKLMKIGDTLEKLSEALKNLDIESIEQYSQMLESMAYITSP